MSKVPPRPGRAPTASRQPQRPGAAPGGLLRAARLLALPAALACAILVHAPALRTFFAQDDVTFLSRARGLEPTPWSLARPLSEGWTWRLLYAVFDLHPLPYHLWNLGLHLANVVLVFSIAQRLLASRPAAFSAALLFGVSSIAFTPLHWASCVVELLVTTFSLSAFRLWLAGRERGRPGLLWLSAALGLAALLSKESAILYPLALVVAHLRLGPRAPGARPLVPQLVATSLYAVAFLATLRLVHYVGSEAYSMSRSPGFIAANLATYLSWLVALQVPVRDAFAAVNPEAWRVGLPVAAAIAAALWSQRREPRHPEEVGAAWFAAFLIPVVPLEHHTYLYYLYLPWPGLCWMLAGLGQRLARRRSPAPARALAAALLAFAGVEFWSVRARERATLGPFAQDKTVRESRLLANAVAGLREAEPRPGDRVAFVNPAPPRHFGVADSTAMAAGEVHSYIPLEGALRQGEAIRLFFPGVTYLGFGTALPREWEDAMAFLYRDDGTMRPLGRGSPALAELGYFALRLRQWKDAEAMFLRSRARGDTVPDATFGLIITSHYLGRLADSDRFAEEFLRRWPNDARAAVVAGSSSDSVAGAGP